MCLYARVTGQPAYHVEGGLLARMNGAAASPSKGLRCPQCEMEFDDSDHGRRMLRDHILHTHAEPRVKVVIPLLLG